jgi:sortase A
LWAGILLAAGSIAFVAGFTLLLSSLAPMFAPRADSANVVAPVITPIAAAADPFTVAEPTPSIPGPKPEVVAPLPAKPVDGSSFELRVPVLGYSAMVHQGVTLSVLARGPGHYTSTPWPGQQGNVGVAGHNTPWLSFGRLKAGDRVEIRTQNGLYVYEITGSRVVDPTDRTVLAQTQDDRLTMTSCYPLWSGALATQRLVFTALRIGGVG